MKAVSMISGGIDSPVASYFMLRRGVELAYVHFHSFPLVSKASVYKVLQLVEVLSRYQSPSVIYFIPLGDVQTFLRTRVDPRYLVVLYRRFMVRLAERVAREEGASAIVTGESLGQVSSQTLQNLRVIDEVAGLPILRPLIGFDKMEIVEVARRIGTYEISIKPQEDCCTLFVPRRQVTGARLEKVREIEASLPVEDLVERASERKERRIIERTR